MAGTTGCEEFYGAAILVLRWCVRRWTQQHLAKESGVSSTSISNYERGETMPGTDERRKVAAALGVPLAGLDRLAAAGGLRACHRIAGPDRRKLK